MTILETYFSLKNTSPFVHNSGVARGGWGARDPPPSRIQKAIYASVYRVALENTFLLPLKYIMLTENFLTVPFSEISI